MEKKLVGRAALLAAIYNESNLPSAIVISEDDVAFPVCLHALRVGPESLFESLFKRGVDRQNGSSKEEVVFTLYPFYDKFPYQGHMCCGCSINEDTMPSEHVHSIEDSEKVSHRLCEECP